MKIKPSEKLKKRKADALKKVQAFAWENDYSTGILPFSMSPGAVDLGMSGVPVLDQGQYGTCVTFATTAALDALYNVGDRIDQQCSLALNKALGRDYWNGAYYSSEIIDPLRTYGVVKKNGCTTRYPSPYTTVSPSTYSRLKDTTFNVASARYVYYGNITQQNVKTALKAGHRVTIGFMMADRYSAYDPDKSNINGFDMYIGGRYTSGGLWACYQPSKSYSYNCGYGTSGHEVIIIGYDDAQKLFKIRNSWSTRVGDSGDYYMSYEFFDAMVTDGTEIFL